jgi:ABC-type amino acid transport substrate-binding protein
MDVERNHEKYGVAMFIWRNLSDLMQRFGTGAVGLALALGALPLQAALAVRFAPEKDYAPFVSETPEGRLQGLSIDVLEALTPLLDIKLTILPAQPLNRILESAQRGEVDLVSSLRPTPERAAYLSFTAPYIQVPAVLVVRQSVSPARLTDLDGQRVAVGQGYAVESFVRQNYRRVDWQAVPDDLAGLQGLVGGRYQGVVADIASVSHAIRAHQITGVQVVDAIGFEYPLSFAYRKDFPALGQQLDAALIKLDPQTRQKITDRWIDARALQFEDPKRTGWRWLGLGLAVLAMAVLGWPALRRWLARPGV